MKNLDLHPDFDIGNKSAEFDAGVQALKIHRDSFKMINDKLLNVPGQISFNLVDLISGNAKMYNHYYGNRLQYASRSVITSELVGQIQKYCKLKSKIIKFNKWFPHG